nr:hypothetical protein CFP56_65715 [Quercus suber]
MVVFWDQEDIIQNMTLQFNIYPKFRGLTIKLRPTFNVLQAQIMQSEAKTFPELSIFSQTRLKLDYNKKDRTL